MSAVIRLFLAFGFLSLVLPAVAEPGGFKSWAVTETVLGEGGQSAEEVVERASFDAAGRLVSRSWREGDKERSVVREYSRDGRLVLEREEGGEAEPTIARYFYDEAGALLRIRKHSGAELISVVEIARTGTGDAETWVERSPAGAILSGQRISRFPAIQAVVTETFDAEGNALLETTLCHDNGGRVTRRRVRDLSADAERTGNDGAAPKAAEASPDSDAKPESKDEWIEYQYDGEGLLVAETALESDGVTIVRRTAYLYDERGFLVETRSEEYREEPSTEVLVYSHKLDKRGNWVVMEGFRALERFGDRVLVPAFTRRRDISYR